MSNADSLTDRSQFRQQVGQASRRLACQLSHEANWSQGGAAAGFIGSVACVYASMPKMAITLAVIAVFLQFVTLVMRHDAEALNQLADLYDNP
jgi:hypothetical protein